MKKVVNILIVIIVMSLMYYYLVPSEEAKTEENHLQVQVKILDKLSSENFKNRKGAFYSISVELINNSDSIVSFWIMSCSWEDCWISNSDTVILDQRACDGNYPDCQHLKQGQKLAFNGILWNLDSTKIVKRNNLRLGLIYVKENEYSIAGTGSFRQLLIDKMKESKNIVWSEPFAIKE